MPCPRTQQANLPACSPQPPTNAERQAGKLRIPFKVFRYDSTRGMNPRSTDCEADALTTTPSRRLKNYLCIKTTKLRFLDIRHFVAPGFSYRKFLIAYDSVQTKFYFPYQFVTDLTKLKSGLQEHQAFYSLLSKSNITKEEYEFVKKTWIEKGWNTLKDMLIYYCTICWIVCRFLLLLKICFYPTNNRD